MTERGSFALNGNHLYATLKATETLHPRKKKVRIDNSEDFDDFSLVATCPIMS